MLIVGVALYVGKKPDIATKATLYRLGEYLDNSYAQDKTYLEGLHQVSFWETSSGKSRILWATSTKELTDKEFEDLLDGLIENGYVVQGGWNQVMEIKNREINDIPNGLVIEDTGVSTAFGDVPGITTSYKEITLQYTYERLTGKIFFMAFSTDSSDFED